MDSVALQLGARKQPYADQATFSFAVWPFSLKLLWAPLVDALYWRRLGRRKSWCASEHEDEKEELRELVRVVESLHEYSSKLMAGMCTR